MEDEKLGVMADKVKAKATETGQEALSRGQQVARTWSRARPRQRRRAAVSTPAS